MAIKTNKRPSDIRLKFKRKRPPLLWSANYDNARVICASYHNLFGGCLVLDDDRMEAILGHLIDAERSVEQILAAIRAYHRHVTTDPYYRKDDKASSTRPAGTNAHRDLASFLGCGQFDRFLEEGIGELCNAKLAGLSTQDSVLSPAAEAALYGEYLAADRERKLALLNQAEAELKAARIRVTHDSCRAKIAEILRAEQAKTVSP